MSPRDESATTMSEAKRRFFSGDTLRQALVQAANYHHLDPERIGFKTIDKRHGFLKTRRRVMIEVDPEAPERPAGAQAPAQSPFAGGSRAAVAPAAPARPPLAAPPPATTGGSDSAGSPADRTIAAAPSVGAPPLQPRIESERGAGRDRERAPRPAPREAPRRPAPASVRETEDGGLVALPETPRRASERYPAATGAAAEAAQKGLDLLLAIAGLDLTARIHQGEERLEIDLSGPASERCFDDDGELLMSIEHLLSRVIRAVTGETVLCRVDCDNYHEIREEQLRTLAQRVAEEVRRRGRSRTLEPMNPADRRIVHMTLADDPHVETESDGEGYFKRVTVRPR